ncbi:hypothetical protein MPSEU_000874300 [Mayamaea pseudoterrestris]|nr:hypothetical protein MPSEU_000874300 [Mayamaea pseudoterrestris]
MRIQFCIIRRRSHLPLVLLLLLCLQSKTDSLLGELEETLYDSNNAKSDKVSDELTLQLSRRRAMQNMQFTRSPSRSARTRNRFNSNIDIETPSLSEIPSAGPSLPSINHVNLLVITADQLRYDALAFIQNRMSIYNSSLKVKTPNIDRLASQGVHFETAYCQTSSCAPARATLRSGCTIERTGVQSNDNVRVKHSPASFKYAQVLADKVDAVRTYDQVLHEAGYQVESYGKFHLPQRWYYDVNNTQRAIRYDTYSTDMKTPTFTGAILTDPLYVAQLLAWRNNTPAKRSDHDDGQLTNPRSGFPYTPIRLDQNYGNRKPSGRDDDKDDSNSLVMGVDTFLPLNQSLAAYTGTLGLLALQRLAAQRQQPWALTVSFENPHPPYVVSEAYASYYLERSKQILVPPSKYQVIQNKYYASMQRASRLKGFTDTRAVQEWTAVYYAMVEQVDVWVGRILDELEAQGLAEHTLVVLTADHGEFLGAHGLQGKSTFLEEATRVPLIMRLPGIITEGTVVTRPVAHLDVYSTILDYLEHSEYDSSDGNSLRPAVTGTSLRELYEDEFVVGEMDTQDVADKTISGFPNFMVRHGGWKLMIAKFVESKSEDLLFNVAEDPFEMNNLLSKRKSDMEVIGKAEHLKCLLREWMARNDGGNMGYYSRPKYNGNEGQGDMAEIRRRRSWDAVDQWISDTKLFFNQPVFSDNKWRSNAWLYIGRTTPGALTIFGVNVVGTGSQFFEVSQTSGRIRRNGYMRIKISFVADDPVNSDMIGASIVVESSAYRKRIVRIVPWNWPGNMPNP